VIVATGVVVATAAAIAAVAIGTEDTKQTKYKRGVPANKGRPVFHFSTRYTGYRKCSGS
jgi:hypothetical protein